MGVNKGEKSEMERPPNSRIEMVELCVCAPPSGGDGRPSPEHQTEKALCRDSATGSQRCRKSIAKSSTDEHITFHFLVLLAAKPKGVRRVGGKDFTLTSSASGGAAGVGVPVAFAPRLCFSRETGEDGEELSVRRCRFICISFQNPSLAPLALLGGCA